MSKRIYVDTNVWIDFFLNRNDSLRPLGEFAFELFYKTLGCSFTIVVSDWLLTELKNTGHYKSYENLQGELKKKDKIIFIETTRADIDEAKTKSQHFEDALHEVLALRGGAVFLVTRNVRDFDGSQIPICLPEWL
ncbi:MAG: type II toxin-antitoxin system VapC family toxin [Candidatus Woesearchaeota archaeon]